MDYFNSEVWEKWANENYDDFKSLKDGSKIAMLLPDTDNLIIIEKGNRMTVEIDDRYSFEFPFAQIAFKFTDGTVDKVLKDSSLVTMKKLVLDNDIGIMSFVDEKTLNEHNYRNFLKRFGFEIGPSCTCGCC